MNYGFYSSKADGFFGHSIYLNKNNQEIKITYVTKDVLVGYLSYLWSDKVYVGEIFKFVRSEKKKNYDKFVRSEKKKNYDKHLDYKRHSLRSQEHLPWHYIVAYARR
jgi:hypothetical protein